MRRKGLILFVVAFIPWLCLAVLSYLDLPLWGAAAGLAVVLSMFILMPSGRKWGILQAFSILFFVVACAAVLVLGEELDTRIANLLAGGFACLTIMAGYGVLEGISFPSHYLNIDYPESMHESPVLRRTLKVLSLKWYAIFILGLAGNIVCMLVLSGETSSSVASIISMALFGGGIIASPLIVLVLPHRFESELVEKGPLSIKWQPPVLTPGGDLRKNEYDAAIVGSGIGGLACASILSHSGMKVVVAEKGRVAGGYCQTYNWKGYALNAGPTMMLGGAGGAVNALSRRLGLEEEIPLKRLEWGLADGKIALRLGSGIEEDMKKIGNKFPSCREGLKRFMYDLRRFRGELMDRPDYLSSSLPYSLDEYHEQFLRHPFSALWQNTSFQDVLDDYLPDDRLTTLLGRLAAILGGDPRTLPAYEGARIMVALFMDGTYYPMGHFSQLIGKLVGLIRERGGEVLTSCGAEEVLIQGEGHRAAPIGLRLADGTQIRSSVVVLDLDPRQALTRLLKPSYLGMDFVKEMEKLKPSCSAYLLHLVFDEDLRMPDRVFLFPARPRQLRTGDTYLEVDSLILAKEKHTGPDSRGCVLMARINVPPHCYHVFEEGKQASELGLELATLVKEEVGTILPAVKKASKAFVTLPTHFSRLTSNGQGAAFGFAPLLSQWYYDRPGPRLPLSNLYLVGAWSRYGGGLEGAAMSGIVAARELCGEHPYQDFTISEEEVAVDDKRGEAAVKEKKRSFLRRRKPRKAERDAGE